MKNFGILFICVALLIAGVISGCQRPSPINKKNLPKPGDTDRIKVKGANLSLKDFKGHIRWDLDIEDVQENADGMRLNRVTGSYFPPKGGPPLKINADEGWINPEYDRLELRNGVEMKREKFSLHGQLLGWNASSGAIKLTGNVVVKSDAMQGKGEIMSTDADFRNVRFEGGSTWNVLRSAAGSKGGKTR